MRAVSECCHHSPSICRQPALGLDRGAQLLVDLLDLRRGRLGVPHAGQAQQVGRQLRAVGVQDERAPHAEHAAEQTGLEHHVVARRRLAGCLAVRRSSRPAAKMNAAKSTSWVRSTSRWSVEVPGVERRGPRLHVGDVLEAAGQRVEQLGLLARRTEEDPRLSHAGILGLAILSYFGG